MNAKLFNQGVDGLSAMKKLRNNAIFNQNKELADSIDQAIINVNGEDLYISELMKLHEPIRKNVNRSLATSLSSLDPEIRNPQFEMILAQIQSDMS